MHCPFCNHTDTQVMETRVLDGGPLPFGDERSRRVLDAQVTKEARRVRDN